MILKKKQKAEKRLSDTELLIILAGLYSFQVDTQNELISVASDILNAVNSGNNDEYQSLIAKQHEKEETIEEISRLIAKIEQCEKTKIAVVYS